MAGSGPDHYPQVTSEDRGPGPSYSVVARRPIRANISRRAATNRVMAGLDPAIHPGTIGPECNGTRPDGADGRVKPGHNTGARFAHALKSAPMGLRPPSTTCCGRLMAASRFGSLPQPVVGGGPAPATTSFPSSGAATSRVPDPLPSGAEGGDGSEARMVRQLRHLAGSAAAVTPWRAPAESTSLRARRHAGPARRSRLHWAGR